MTDPTEQAYRALERAYGEGEFARVITEAATLLEQLSETPGHELSWRTQLLLGNAHLHGLQQPQLAQQAFAQVLEHCSPTAPERALAEQGLADCQGAPPPAMPWLEQMAPPAPIAQAHRPPAVPAPPTAAAAAGPAPAEVGFSPAELAELKQGLLRIVLG
jgi:hypothetical protein